MQSVGWVAAPARARLLGEGQLAQHVAGAGLGHVDALLAHCADAVRPPHLSQASVSVAIPGDTHAVTRKCLRTRGAQMHRAAAPAAPPPCASLHARAASKARWLPKRSNTRLELKQVAHSRSRPVDHAVRLALLTHALQHLRIQPRPPSVPGSARYRRSAAGGAREAAAERGAAWRGEGGAGKVCAPAWWARCREAPCGCGEAAAAAGSAASR